MGTYFAATSRHWPFDAGLRAADVPIAGLESQPEPSRHCRETYRGTNLVRARFIVTTRIGSCVGQSDDLPTDAVVPRRVTAAVLAHSPQCECRDYIGTVVDYLTITIDEDGEGA